MKQGSLLAGLGRTDQSIPFLRRALQTGDPDSSRRAAFILGLIQLDRGEMAEARNAFQVPVDSQHPEVALRAADRLHYGFTKPGPGCREFEIRLMTGVDGQLAYAAQSDSEYAVNCAIGNLAAEPEPADAVGKRQYDMSELAIHPRGYCVNYAVLKRDGNILVTSITPLKPQLPRCACEGKKGR